MPRWLFSTSLHVSPYLWWILFIHRVYIMLIMSFQSMSLHFSILVFTTVNYVFSPLSILQAVCPGDIRYRRRISLVLNSISCRIFPLLLKLLEVMATFSTVAKLHRKESGQKWDKSTKIRSLKGWKPLDFAINLQNIRNNGKLVSHTEYHIAAH